MRGILHSLYKYILRFQQINRWEQIEQLTFNLLPAITDKINNNKKYRKQNKRLTMRQKKSVSSKYVDGTLFTNSNSNQISEMRQQLRQAIQQLQQHKLSSELQSQKCRLIQQQYQQLQFENQQMRTEMQVIRKELGKISKKYNKIKQNKHCQKCKVDSQYKDNIDRERQIFMRERVVLKNQIKQLKQNVQMLRNGGNANYDEMRLVSTIQQIRKELQFKNKTIEQQRKVIRFLDQKLSTIQRQKLQTLDIIDALQHRLQQLQMENNILKGHPKKQAYSPCRKTGSIKNLQKLDKSRLSRDT